MKLNSLCSPSTTKFISFINTLPSKINPQFPIRKKSVIRCAVSFRPCIDIHKGKVKQIVGSTLSDSGSSALVTNFESDKSAGEYARLYKEDGLMGGHVIMLGADPLSQAATIEALQAYPGPPLRNSVSGRLQWSVGWAAWIDLLYDYNQKIVEDCSEKKKV